jgi:probable rRNA maturation factor
MNIYYSDEEGRLNPEIKSLMEKAALKALGLEFPDVLEKNSMKPEDLDAEIGVTVVDAEEIRELNRDYRGNDSVTDVLSFPQYDDMEELAYDLADEAVTALIGDVVICYDRVLSQAEEFGTGVTREFVYLFTHSILHLMGYDHMEEDEKREMRSREEEILGSIGVNRQ